MAIIPTEDSAVTRVRANKALNSEVAGGALFAALDPGCTNGHLLVFTHQPTAGDTIEIGADTYEFRAAEASVSDDDHIAVAIGADAAATQANLIAAINATVAGNAHPTIFGEDDETPAKANGTENVKATAVSTSILVQHARYPGGEVIASDASLTVAESVTAAQVVWTYGNVNFNTLGGHAPAKRSSHAAVTITAAMIAAGTYPVRFPFTPTAFQVQVRTSAGVVRAVGTDSFAVAAGAVVLTLAGGSAPNIQATDVVTVVAFE